MSTSDVAVIPGWQDEKTSEPLGDHFSGDRESGCIVITHSGCL